MHRLAFPFITLPLLALFACGGGDNKDGATADASTASQPDAGTAGQADANTDSDWVPLITGDWTLGPGDEDSSDNHSITLDRDIYISAIRPVDPVGTHHALLSIEGGSGVVYASGVGTNELFFPEGVGLKLVAGTVLDLQLHVFNVSDSSLSGTSGVEIVEVSADKVTQVADVFLPGPFDFNLPAGESTTHSGDCVVNQAQTLFALFPHMHQLGTHFKMSVTQNGTPQVVHDAAYDFDEQKITSFAPIELAPGDSITTECTWFNTLATPVGWGDGSEQEMCFSILYRYPAIADNDFCIN